MTKDHRTDTFRSKRYRYVQRGTKGGWLEVLGSWLSSISDLGGDHIVFTTEFFVHMTNICLTNLYIYYIYTQIYILHFIYIYTEFYDKEKSKTKNKSTIFQFLLNEILSFHFMLYKITILQFLIFYRLYFSHLNVENIRPVTMNLQILNITYYMQNGSLPQSLPSKASLNENLS